MPSATLDAIIYRSSNPVSRAIDVVCLIILQLLTLMVLAAEQDPAKLRNHPALGPHSILARLEAGDSFDLPLILIAAIRAVASGIRADLRLGGFGFKQPGAPIPALPQNPAAPAKAKAKAKRRRPTAPNRAAPTPNRAPRRTVPNPNQSTGPPCDNPGPCEKSGLARSRLATPISLRCRNESGSSLAKPMTSQLR
jgi:hypothetical protein